MSQITAIQFRRAQMLARAYGHEWGQVLVTLGEEADPLAGTYPDRQCLALSLPADAAAIAAAIDEHLGPDRSMPGLGFATSHVTGSGRLRWDVHESGEMGIWVLRPGSTLVALRAMGEAARVAFPDSGEACRAALAALCGPGIEYGAVSDANSPLGAEMLARRQGVCVLFASISSDGAIEIDEVMRKHVASDEDVAELRHWVALREALSALGLSLPSPRPEVVEALATYDAACTAQRAANASGDEARIAAAYEAVDRAYNASVLPAAGVEFSRRRRASDEAPRA